MINDTSQHSVATLFRYGGMLDHYNDNNNNNGFMALCPGLPG